MIRIGFNEKGSQMRGFRDNDGAEKDDMINVLFRISIDKPQKSPCFSEINCS